MGAEVEYMDVRAFEVLHEVEQREESKYTPEELWQNLSRTTARAGHLMEQRLRPHGLSPTQYNVLQILRVAGPVGLCQNDVGKRLAAQVPDVPRILDRMVRSGWVQRVRGVTDRRLVIASLTEVGSRLAASLDDPVEDIVLEVFGGLDREQVRTLHSLLMAAQRR